MIFTERTIKIANDVCEIDNPIVLYRGDYNVEIRFTIIECPYKYSTKNSTNIIETVDASYGQLVIKVPNDGSPIFSDVVETNKGSIVFTLSGEMIDESVEVGDYTFQIRLFDANKESRATIPPIENGISIREPIASEDITTTNEVGVATVGYALTTAATSEDAFDSQGNYNKTTWGIGDRITAAKLNKIEAGIDGVNQKVASGGSGQEVDLSIYQTKTDNTLNTTDKTVAGAINEINEAMVISEDQTGNITVGDIPIGGSDDAKDILITDVGGYYEATSVEEALQEVGTQITNVNTQIEDVNNNINNKADKDEFYYNYKQAKAKSSVAIFLDDVMLSLYEHREDFKTRGIQITGGLRLDSVSDSGFDASLSSDGGAKPTISYAQVKELQDDYGIDFAYHGTKHGAHWGTTWSIDEDINTYLESTSAHGIKVNGYIGPNGANLPTASKDKFLWRRNGLKNTGLTTNSDLYFYPENHINIDDIGTASRLEAYKAVIDTLSKKSGHVLSLSGHVPTIINLDNFWTLIDYIISKDIDIITATEARMRYGYAVARLPEKTMIDDILGLTGTGNYTLPNYFTMSENGVIKSNYCPVRWVDVSNIATPNINNINNFELGTTIISGGSMGNVIGVPTVGTTLINRYGKNGEDFMLFRAYNDAGLYFRDVKTRQRWDKIGIVSTTVPSSPTDTGYVGEMAVDANYLYVCVALNTWIRIAKDSTWA